MTNDGLHTFNKKKVIKILIYMIFYDVNEDKYALIETVKLFFKCSLPILKSSGLLRLTNEKVDSGK